LTATVSEQEEGMERRTLGRTGLKVSADQEQAVARAVELGINYFDTAPLYGDGESERSLGRVLRTLRPDVYVGTKFRIQPGERGRVAEALTASLEASLRRLGLDRVDLLQLHNPISSDGSGFEVTTVLDQIVPALERLRQQGKIRFLGITALGDTASLHRVIGARVLDTAQVCYNLLNPSAGVTLPRGFPAHDFAKLLDRAREAAVGVIGIRVLAAGALSGTEARHPIAVPSVEPIASGPDYRTDVRHAHWLDALVREGHARSLVEAALRFAIANDAMSTVLVGYSSLDHLEYAAACVNRGPLPPAALDRLATLWQGATAESAVL
jgi:aryl-alcohol dehydrogenase-like predicted oxidoreductase